MPRPGGGAESVEVLCGLLVAGDRLAVDGAGAVRGADVGEPDLLRVVKDLLEVPEELGVADVAADAAQPVPAQQPAQLLIAPARRSRAC